MVASFNIFRICGDISHVLSFIYLFKQILKTRSFKGISVETHTLYLTVFLTRYIDLFFRFKSNIYNSLMKILLISSTAIIVYYYNVLTHKEDKRRKLELKKLWVYVVPCLVLALVWHYNFSLTEVLYAFSLYLEAIAILPQIMLLQRSKAINNLTAQYVAFLGAYRFFYILNWIYRYVTNPSYRGFYITWFSGIIQTVLYCDFFYYYLKAKLVGKEFVLPM
eukprot:TRINITY_DN1988_c0_g1_i1.p1 TRINITY_DN1988_c0_g1~~TRINITY_DN1988_c0_g1_i1.p1  ORF type:complete len:221 (+),score=29.82 TRINITY_DN1988_c0_g1_i1:40-702(+)